MLERLFIITCFVAFAAGIGTLVGLTAYTLLNPRVPQCLTEHTACKSARSD